ncbi:hypothetical protein BC834DRAFT_332261 [Gloeopeniophorella convolvens]|nr:hypothetical protein BC834DRAFT_332261 [Gloeopeniophorella convolvens]
MPRSAAHGPMQLDEERSRWLAVRHLVGISSSWLGASATTLTRRGYFLELDARVIVCSPLPVSNCAAELGSVKLEPVLPSPILRTPSCFKSSLPSDSQLHVPLCDRRVCVQRILSEILRLGRSYGDYLPAASSKAQLIAIRLPVRVFRLATWRMAWKLCAGQALPRLGYTASDSQYEEGLKEAARGHKSPNEASEGEHPSILTELTYNGSRIHLPQARLQAAEDRARLLQVPLRVGFRPLGEAVYGELHPVDAARVAWRTPED